MARIPRSATGNMVYHVLNRSNSRAQIFKTEADYQAFEDLLAETKEKYPMRILAYCLMPNHWHLLLYPEHTNDLPKFMRYLGLTHTQRWHKTHNGTRVGHLYQGRYKSFLVQTDKHFLQVARYVERNPLRANLVKQAQAWRWSSLWLRSNGSSQQKKILSKWPHRIPQNYVTWVNKPQQNEKEELKIIRYAIERSSPYGEEAWVIRTAKALNLQSTLNPRGRPRKKIVS